MRSLPGSLLVAAVLCAGCASDVDRPKEPAWGRQPCEECAMLLSDRHYGAQLVTKDGDRLYFDDVGCMAEWTIEHPQQAERRWVRTEDSAEWVAADEARYLRGRQSPMFGLAATAEGGQLSWADVTAVVQQRMRER